jgi:hypothetical protein
MPGTAAKILGRQNECVIGRVIWYHADLRFAFIECRKGLTLGTIERGQLDLFHEVRGELDSKGSTVLANISTGKKVLFTVEAGALSEEQANELLGLVQD